MSETRGGAVLPDPPGRNRTGPGGLPANPTERPEERDSLGVFAEHLSSPDDDDNAGYHHYVIRTLINEVKERDERLAHHDELFQAFQANKTDLEAEVKELREETKLATRQTVNAINRKVTVENDLKERDARIKQMEEALREAWACIDLKPDRFPQGTIERVRAALSPSDTETRS